MFNWDYREQFTPEVAQGGWGEINPPMPDYRRGWDERTPVLRNRRADDLPPEVLRTPNPGEDAWYRTLFRPHVGQQTQPFTPDLRPIPLERSMDFLDPTGVGMHGAGGLVKWGGKIYDNMYFARGMRRPENEIKALDYVLNNAEKIKRPHDQSVSLVTPAFTPHVADSGVLYHGDMDKDVKALGVGDIYSWYGNKGNMLGGGNYDKAMEHLVHLTNLEDARPKMDILQRMGETLGSYDTARHRLRSALSASGDMDYFLRHEAATMADNARNQWEDLFTKKGVVGGAQVFQPRYTGQHVRPSGERVDYGPIEGEFSLLSSPKALSIWDARHKVRTLMNNNPVKQEAREYLRSDRPDLLYNPKQTSAEEFFGAQANRFNSFVNKPQWEEVKPSGFYNEAVHTLGRDVNDRLAGVFVDMDNPNEAVLEFAKRRGLPVFALPKGAEDTAEQTGRQFWADMFNKGVNNPPPIQDMTPEQLKLINKLHDVNGLNWLEAKERVAPPREIKGEWVPTRKSTGAGKVIRENQDAILNYFRQHGLFTPDPDSGVTGEGGMKDVIRWARYYGLDSKGGLPRTVEDAINKSVGVFAPYEHNIDQYLKSSLMPTNRRLHYSGLDFPFE